MNLYREEPWTKHAECLSIGVEAFYPAKGEDWTQPKAVCLTVCPVRLQCLDYAMRMEVGSGHHFRAGALRHPRRVRQAPLQPGGAVRGMQGREPDPRRQHPVRWRQGPHDRHHQLLGHSRDRGIGCEPAGDRVAVLPVPEGAGRGVDPGSAHGEAAVGGASPPADPALRAEEGRIVSTAIYPALVAVMEQVGAVKKNDRNDHAHFMFRGVDAVVNAVYPALVAHGVVVTPNVRSYDYGVVEVGQGERRKPMGHARVVVEYTFTSAEDGSAITASAAGEAFDSGDKATPKAMSVALRTALLQSLMLPTDEPEPDASSYERAPTQDPIVEARIAVAEAWKVNHPGELDASAVELDFSEWTNGEYFKDATADRLYAYAEHLKGEVGA